MGVPACTLPSSSSLLPISSWILGIPGRRNKPIREPRRKTGQETPLAPANPSV